MSKLLLRKRDVRKYKLLKVLLYAYTPQDVCLGEYTFMKDLSTRGTTNLWKNCFK